MKSALKITFLLCLSILLAAVSGLAGTLTETQTFTFTPTLTPFSVLSTPPVKDFNPAMGTLDSIQIDVSGSTAGDAIITNMSSSVGVYTFSIVTVLGVLDPTSSLLFTITPTVSGSLTVASGATDSTGLLTSPTVSDSELLTSSIQFLPYVGVGTYNFGLTGVGNGDVTGPVPFTASEAIAAAADGDVIYTYTTLTSTTPEPSALLLLGSAVGLLGLRLRRSRPHHG